MDERHLARGHATPPPPSASGCDVNELSSGLSASAQNAPFISPLGSMDYLGGFYSDMAASAPYGNGVNPHHWMSYGMNNPSAGLINPESFNSELDKELPDNDKLFAMYSNWAAQLAKESNFSLCAESGTSPLLDPDVNECLAKLSQSEASCGSAIGDPQNFLSSHPSLDGSLMSGFDFSALTDSGRAAYAQALNQWNASQIDAADSTPNAGSSLSMPSSPTYDPFGVRNVFQSEPVSHEMPPLQPATLNVEAKPRSASLPNPESSPVNKPCPAAQDDPPTSARKAPNPPFSASPVFNKPSYSDVAKNKTAPATVDSMLGKKPEKAKLNQHSYAFQDSHSHPQPGPKGHSSHHPKGGAHRRSRKSNLPKSKGAQLEPTMVKPNSRYGLDTFDDPDALPSHTAEEGDASASNKASSEAVENLCSFESDAPQQTNIPMNTPLKEDLPPKESLLGAKKNDTSRPFFDPKRIFAPKKGKSSSKSESSNHKASNDKSFVPNNEQQTSPAAHDTMLNNGKPKSSFPISGNSINQSCYINNDLRDSRKQTNTESSNYHNHSEGRHSERAPRDSKKSEEEPHYASRKKHDGVRRKRDSLSGSKTPFKSCKRNARSGSPISLWLMQFWGWLHWALPELGFIVLNLLKMVLSLGLIMLISGYHVLRHVLELLWAKILHVFPSLSKRFSSSSSSGSAFKVQGLKENITLPSTGDEAMKRLLACKGKDPYSILGLRSDVSDEEIKKYYRKQAVLVHPDKNQQPGAEEAFKILGHAFELVGEPEKRRLYDAQLIEDLESEKAMQEFADLLTKLNEKVQEAANLMRCEHCGGKHRRIPVDRPAFSARMCDRCNIMHPAREGDVWAESQMLGFLWHYYACMEGKVYDITEWASCQKKHFQHISANAHHVIYRISTNANHGQPTRSGNKEADLEDFLSHLFHHSSNDIPDGYPGFPRNPGQQQSPGPNPAWNNSTSSSTSSANKKGRRKKKKH